MRKLVIAGMATCLLLISALPASAAEPAMHGRSSLLLDGLSGQVLYQQNGYVKNFPASTTKILTALVAVEHGNLAQKIKVSSKAVDLPPDSSSCYLEKGEEQTLESLLYGLLLVSGNDCAVAIAEGVSSGNMPQFITWMNETAKKLGAVNSNFTNAHGLHDPNHYTTALDLALIARASFANPIVHKIATTPEYRWPGKSERNGPYNNHNPVLSYEGTTGGKTGFTEEADLTLVNTATRNGRFLVAVVMGEKLKIEEINDMVALLDYGFQQFEQRPLIEAGMEYGELAVTGGKAKAVPAIAKENFLVTALKGTQPKITVQQKIDPSVAAPVSAGQRVGVLEVKEGDRLLTSVPVVSAQTVQSTTFATLASITPAKLFGPVVTVLKWLGILFLSLLLFRFVVKTIRRARRRSRRQVGVTRRNQSGSMIRSYRTRQ